jgi:hypothetical protein
VTARRRKPYSDEELRLVLSLPPTRINVARLAVALQRSPNGIRIIYELACSRRRHLRSDLLSTKTWRQVRRIAAELGWVTVQQKEAAE